MTRFVLRCTLVVVAVGGVAPTQGRAQSVSDQRLAELMRQAATQSGYVTAAQAAEACEVPIGAVVASSASSAARRTRSPA